MKCPNCGNSLELQQETIEKTKELWAEYDNFPAGSCAECEITVWSDSELTNLDFYERPKDQIPDMSEGTVVYVDNKEHDRYLQPARVVARDHLHYRLQFWDGRIWMPYHWVKPLPKDMLVFNNQ